MKKDYDEMTYAERLEKRAVSCTPEFTGSVSCAEIGQLMNEMDDMIVSRNANDPDNGYSIGVMECADLVGELLNKIKQNDLHHLRENETGE